MPKRRHQRVPLKRTIGLRKFGQADNIHIGTTIDFSPDGCAIQHDNPALHCGMRVKLRLALPDRAECLEIHHATVTWTRQHRCGIRFIALTPEEQARVMMVYDLLLQAQAPEEEGNVPPLIFLQPL